MPSQDKDPPNTVNQDPDVPLYSSQVIFQLKDNPVLMLKWDDLFYRATSLFNGDSSMELCDGRVRLSVWERFFIDRVIWGLEQAPQGSGHGHKLPEF